MEKRKILLHCCCAVCACHCIERLINLNYEVILFFANSNIDTKEEFEKRYNELIKLSKIYGLKLILEEYDHESYLEAISGYENEPERGKRCSLCFAFNFSLASYKAQSLGINFTTTLSVSPHKDSDVIMNEGARFDNFEFFNFKKQNGFLETMILAKKYSIYHQNYCGCEFSKRADS